MYSIIIPIYRNEDSLPELMDVLEKMSKGSKPLQVVFVVDGSPDLSHITLAQRLPQAGFEAILVAHSRNFGSFSAVRTGLLYASGRYIAVMSADLQDPPTVIKDFFRVLEAGDTDVVVGTRQHRDDPWLSVCFSNIYWGIYRRFIQPQMPKGGVDIFAFNEAFKEHLKAFQEINTSIVGLLFWLGFRTRTVPYERLRRKHGKSSWTLAKKLRYLFDSVFSFSDLPINVMIGIGALGLLTSLFLGTIVLIARLSGRIAVPGYTATALIIMFFGGLNSLGLGLVGSYVWRAFENTKGRPVGIVMSVSRFPGKGAPPPLHG